VVEHSGAASAITNKVAADQMEGFESFTEKERERFYRQQIERLTPPVTEHHEALLRAYLGLLEAVADAVGESSTGS
jgi:hypothetical protein